MQTGGDGTAYYGEEVIKEKALSKKQQRFFGIVRAIQKGEQEPTTPETAKAAADMKKSDVKKYASTKHTKLPEKKIDESAIDFSKIDRSKIVTGPYRPKRDAEGNIIPPKLIKGPYKGPNPFKERHPGLTPLSKGGEIKEAVPLIVKAAMLGAGMLAKKALAGKKKKKDKDEVGPTTMMVKVVEGLDEKDKPFIKKLIKNLKKGSKTHEKQAKKLEKAMNEDITDEALTIQNWNVDDIKFTEIETIDIIKAKPLLGEKTNPLQGLMPHPTTPGKMIPDPNYTGPKPVPLPRSSKVIPKPKGDDPGFKLSGEAAKKMKDRLNASESKKNIGDHYDWRTEIDEDWQKVNRKDKTDGLSKKAVKAYRRENPGSKLQTAVTKDPKKLKKGSKSAKRRLSFCRRMKGMKKKLTSAKTRRDPDSRINKALRRWNC